jgi:hypothetical protein
MRRVSLKTCVVAILIVFLAASSLSCGQNASQAAELHDLDRIVPRLPSGLSIEEVEERLGEPEAQFVVETGGPETVLTYRLWQLVFRPNLYKRTRFYRAGQWPPGRPLAPLDRKIRALKLGISRHTVEQKVGKTETWQVLILGEDERLWYGGGRWKLHFVDRRLAGKVLYR